MRARVLAVVAAAAAVLGNVMTVGVTSSAADCAPPEVSIAGPVEHPYEGSQGSPTIVPFTVTMGRAATGCPEGDSVRYSTADGTAKDGVKDTDVRDYKAVSGVLDWVPGSHVVQVEVDGDVLKEGDEDFAVELFRSGETAAVATATVNVRDDDANVSGGGLEVAIPEGGICWWPSTRFMVLVRLNTVARAPVSVYLRTVDGTAVAGKDFQGIKDRLVTIPAGADRIGVPVYMLAGAAPGEYFGVEISGPTAGTVGTSHMKVTIKAG